MFKSRLNIRFILVILTALMVMQAYLFYQFIQGFQQDRIWFMHNYKVIVELEQLASEIKENQIEKIGYIATGNSIFLKNDHDLYLRIEKINALAKDDHIQKSKVASLEKLMRKQIDTLNATVKNNANLSPEQAIKLIFSSNVNLVDIQISQIISELIKEEQKLRDIRIYQNLIAKERFYHFNAIAGIVSYIVLVVLILFLMRNLREQKLLGIQRMASDVKFKKLFEVSSDAHILYDSTGIIDCNDAVLKMIKCYQKSQIIGMHPYEFSSTTQPDGKTPETKKIEIEKYARDHGFYCFQWMLKRFDGVEIPIEVSMTPILLNEKETFLVNWHDISEQKKYQNMLEQLHKINSDRAISLDSKIDQILKLGCQYFHLPNGMVGKIIDNTYEVLYCNMPDHGLLPGTILPLSLNSSQLFNIRFLLALEDVGSKEIMLREFQIKSYIGCPVYVNGKPFGNLGFFKSKPRTEEFGETEKTFVHLISQWISREIETDMTFKDLQVNKERLERAIKSSNDGLWEWNCITNKVYVSSRYKQILGYEDNDIDDNLATFAKLIHPDDGEKMWTAVTDTFEKGKHFDIEFRMLKKDGSYVWVYSRGDVFRDQSGKPILMSGFITDVQAFFQDKSDGKRDQVQVRDK